jgi:hypothetical protein
MHNIRPKNPLLWIKYKFLEWQWDRVLKKSGCQHWETFFRKNDPDFNMFGRTIREQLFGYPYVALVKYQHLGVTVDGFSGEIWDGENVHNWCMQHCRGKFRWQWERVIQDHIGHYAPDGIVGTDELFFGFKDERDYMMFILRWS